MIKRKVFTLILLMITFVCFGTQTKVIRVIDGDTFETENGEKVRLIGINAPEISDFYGQEAKNYLMSIVKNKIVELKTDNTSSDRDRYNRLLRYVFLSGVDINKKMILDGFGFAYLKFHFDKSDEYEKAQIISRELNKGIWGNSKKETNNLQKEKFDISIWTNLSFKTYIVGSLVFLLSIIGIYSYFKK
jgi:micrococcal nuclease